MLDKLSFVQRKIMNTYLQDLFVSLFSVTDLLNMVMVRNFIAPLVQALNHSV
jgi:hypothetical protein